MDLAIPALLDPASVVPQKIRLQTTNDGAIELELKSPSLPLFQKGEYLRRLLTALWKRGEGEIFYRMSWRNYVADLWHTTLGCHIFIGESEEWQFLLASASPRIIRVS